MSAHTVASSRSMWMPLKVFFVTMLGVVMFGSGYFLGNASPSLLRSTNAEGLFTTISVPAHLAQELDFDLLWYTWGLIEEQYVDQPVDNQKIFDGLVQGLFTGLDDPYSAYFTPTMAEEFSQEMSGSFFGIGAELDLDPEGIVMVVAPLARTPAEVAGVRSGDRILAIDGEDTVGMTVAQAVSKIRGEKGTMVTLLLAQPDDVAARSVTITRDEIHVESVTATMRPDGIGVITVSMFGDDTVVGFEEAVATLQKGGARGIVVDVRNNPGGYLDAAIALAGYWTGHATVLQEEMRGERAPLMGNGDARFAHTPTVVLVNGGSASASEIFAGALQDYGLARVIGEQTFGKGSVQTYEELPSGGAIKMTVARWLTPLGRSINHAGIIPDDLVTRTADDYHANIDPQLDAAIHFLTTK